MAELRNGGVATTKNGHTQVRGTCPQGRLPTKLNKPETSHRARTRDGGKTIVPPDSHFRRLTFRGQVTRGFRDGCKPIYIAFCCILRCSSEQAVEALGAGEHTMKRRAFVATAAAALAMPAVARPPSEQVFKFIPQADFDVMFQLL